MQTGLSSIVEFKSFLSDWVYKAETIWTSFVAKKRYCFIESSNYVKCELGNPYPAKSHDQISLFLDVSSLTADEPEVSNTN